MRNWFTVEQLNTDTFAISEYNHWEETHCYLLCGTHRALLIDTGLGVENIKKVTDSLTSLPITVATTHVHWDHIGGHKDFEEILVHEAEYDWLTTHFPVPLQTVKNSLLYKPCKFPKDFDINNYQIFKGIPQGILHDGDCIDLGNRQITVIHTPGHSPGHCCYYEPEKENLYSGDLIYSGCLDAFYPTTDPQQFWESITKIQKLNIKRIFPGHHNLNIPSDIVSRIDAAFNKLSNDNKLQQGNGLFHFDDFQIHI